MTHRDDILREIESNEAWLRDVDNLPAMRELQRTKALVGIEVNERWLAGQINDAPPRDLVARIQARTRQALRSVPAHAASELDTLPFASKQGAPYRWPRWATIAGLAAAACAAIVPLLSQNNPGTGGFAWETAFTAFEDTPLDDPIDSLDSELDELESLMQATRTDDDDTPLEYIDGDLYEYFLSDDWWLFEWDDWS